MNLHTIRSILSSPMLIQWPDLSQVQRDHVHRARRLMRQWRKRDRQNRRGLWANA